MSEREQDALLDQLETAKQRGLLAKCTLFAVLAIAACAAIGWALWMLRL